MHFRSPIGFGTAAIGRPQYINIRKEKQGTFSLEEFRQKGMDMLESAYKLGIRYFDTAPGYGMAEDLVLSWLEGKDDPSIELATKWGYTYTANFDPNAEVHEVKEHSLSKLNEQWNKSKSILPTLGTYQIHSATFETGVLENEEVLNRLHELKLEHGLRMGLTTTGDKQAEVLKRALEVQVNGIQIFEVFQVTYNIFDQSLATLAAEVVRQGKRLVVKEALANGRVFPNPAFPHYDRHYRILHELAEKYGTGIDAIALRFCVDSIPAFKVLSGASTAQQLSENIKANDISLEIEDQEMLRSLSVSPQDYWGERKKLAWN